MRESAEQSRAGTSLGWWRHHEFLHCRRPAGRQCRLSITRVGNDPFGAWCAFMGGQASTARRSRDDQMPAPVAISFRHDLPGTSSSYARAGSAATKLAPVTLTPTWWPTPPSCTPAASLRPFPEQPRAAVFSFRSAGACASVSTAFDANAHRLWGRSPRHARRWPIPPLTDHFSVQVLDARDLSAVRTTRPS